MPRVRRQPAGFKLFNDLRFKRFNLTGAEPRQNAPPASPVVRGRICNSVQSSNWRANLRVARLGNGDSAQNGQDRACPSRKPYWMQIQMGIRTQSQMRPSRRPEAVFILVDSGRGFPYHPLLIRYYP